MQDLSGKKFGKYELRERLGRGGMAEVYKAYQPGMDRFVAIKVMLAHLSSDDGFVERFKREAQAVGKLRHPHIVQIFDFGIEDDVYYMAMEFIEWGNLKAHIIQQERLAPETALRIASQLADALDYAHRAGMIHRDLKPANVMFVDRDHKNAVLTDFGIARILGQSGLTGTGMAVGTPSYMSPEAGRGENVDERSDLYALGIILYEMLTGTVPYDADTPLAVIMKHINAPLPTRREYGDYIPAAAEKVMLRCLAKDPADRYATAGELKQALDRALEELHHTRPTEANTVGAVGTRVSSPTAKVDMPTLMAEADKPTTMVQQTAASAAQTGGFPKWLAGVAALAVVAIIAAIAALGGGQQPAEPTAEPTTVAQVTEEATEETTAEVQAVIPTATPEPPTQTPEPPTPTAEPTAVPVVSIQPPHDTNLALLSSYVPLLDEADGLLLNGDIDGAFAIVNAAVEQDPDHYQARFARAMIAAALDRNVLARADSNWVYNRDPDNPLGTIAMWHALMSGNAPRIEAALRVLEQGEEKFPNNADIAWMRARHEWLTSGDMAWSLDALNSAEEGGARGWRYITTAAQVLFANAEYARALPYLELARDSFTPGGTRREAVEAMIAEATAALQAASPETQPPAEQIMQAVPPPRPENLNLLTGISPLADEVDGILFAQGHEAALAWINGILEAEPDNIGALFARSQLVALEWDENQQARQDAERIIELAPDSPLGYIALSDGLLTEPGSDRDQAAAAIQQALAMDPQNPQVLWRVAAFAEWDVRLEALNTAEAAGASGGRYMYYAGTYLYDNYELARALPYLQVLQEAGIGSDYDRDQIRERLAGALIRTNQAARAMPLAQQDIEQNPDGPTFADAAYIAYRAGDFEQARQWARNAVALSSEVPQAQYLLALLAWWDDEDADRAIEELTALEDAQIYSAFINFDFEHDVNLDRARILADANRPEEALAYYESVIETYCCEAWLFEERADTHLVLEQMDAAIADLRTAYEMADDPDYRQALLNRLTELSGN